MVEANPWDHFEVHCNRDEIHRLLVRHAHWGPQLNGRTQAHIEENYPPGWDYSSLKRAFISAGVTIQNPNDINKNYRMPHPDLVMLHFSKDGTFVAEWNDGGISSSFDDFNRRPECAFE